MKLLDNITDEALKSNLEDEFNRKKEVIEKLKARLEAFQNEEKELRTKRRALEREIRAVVKGKPVTAAAPRTRELPRGVLTMAVHSALTGEKGMKVPDIAAKVAKDPEFAKITDLTSKVRNLLNTSSQFARIDRGVFKNAHKALPKNTLFTRLAGAGNN